MVLNVNFVYFAFFQFFYKINLSIFRNICLEFVQNFLMSRICPAQNFSDFSCPEFVQLVCPEYVQNFPMSGICAGYVYKFWTWENSRRKGWSFFRTFSGHTWQFLNIFRTRDWNRFCDNRINRKSILNRLIENRMKKIESGGQTFFHVYDLSWSWSIFFIDVWPKIM